MKTIRYREQYSIFNISTYTGLPEKSETLMTTLNPFNLHYIGSCIALSKFKFSGKIRKFKKN